MHATPGDTFDVIGGRIVFPSGREPSFSLYGLAPALSRDRRNSAAERLGGFHPSPRLSRASVELPGHRGEIGAGVGAEVRTSREVLTKQAIGVLAAAALPRAVRVAEVDIRCRCRW